MRRYDAQCLHAVEHDLSLKISKFAPSPNVITVKFDNDLETGALVKFNLRSVEIVIATDFFNKLVWVNSNCPRALSPCGSSLPSQSLSVILGLEFVALHELMHVECKHFELTDGLPMFHLVSRSEVDSSSFKTLLACKAMHVSRCLELQADHEATELLLGAYSVKRLQCLRQRIAAISSVMILIELSDVENDAQHLTHPKASTRIFQLLGHLVEMWSLPAHLKAQIRGEKFISVDDLPSEEEIQTFSKEVILPAYLDAVALAETAGARSIALDLGTAEEFFADITRAKLGHCDDLVTVGAKEWSNLYAINKVLLSSQG